MRRTTLTVVVLVLTLAIMVFAAVPAFAAPNPPAAAQFGLHTAHCATMGVPGAGHTAIPHPVCSMSADACAGMTM